MKRKERKETAKKEVRDAVRSKVEALSCKSKVEADSWALTKGGEAQKSTGWGSAEPDLK